MSAEVNVTHKNSQPPPSSEKSIVADANFIIENNKRLSSDIGLVLPENPSQELPGTELETPITIHVSDIALLSYDSLTYTNQIPFGTGFPAYYYSDPINARTTQEYEDNRAFSEIFNAANLWTNYNEGIPNVPDADSEQAMPWAVSGVILVPSEQTTININGITYIQLPVAVPNYRSTENAQELQLDRIVLVRIARPVDPNERFLEHVLPDNDLSTTQLYSQFVCVGNREYDPALNQIVLYATRTGCATRLDVPAPTERAR